MGGKCPLSQGFSASIVTECRSLEIFFPHTHTNARIQTLELLQASAEKLCQLDNCKDHILSCSAELLFCSTENKNLVVVVVVGRQRTKTYRPCTVNVSGSGSFWQTGSPSMLGLQFAWSDLPLRLNVPHLQFHFLVNDVSCNEAKKMGSHKLGMDVKSPLEGAAKPHLCWL